MSMKLSRARGDTVPGWTLNKDVDDLAEQFVNEELFKKITGRSFKNFPGIP